MFEKMKSLRIGSREVLGAVEKMGGYVHKGNSYFMEPVKHLHPHTLTGLLCSLSSGRHAAEPLGCSSLQQRNQSLCTHAYTTVG